MRGLATAAGANVTNCSWNCTSTMMVSTIQREAERFSVVLMVVVAIGFRNQEPIAKDLESPGSAQHQVPSGDIATAFAAVGREK